MLPHRFQDVLKGSFSWSAPSGSSHTHNNHLLKESAFIGNVNNNTHKKKSQDDLQALSTFSSLVLTLENASVNCEGGARGNNNSHRFLVPHRCCTTLMSLSSQSVSSAHVPKAKASAAASRQKRKEEHHALLRFLRFALSLSASIE